MTDSSDGKYMVPAGEAFEPGSRGRILKNKLGIIRVRDLEEKELELYMRTEYWMAQAFSDDQRITIADIDELHRQFMGELFAWAGTHRIVNLSKGGFQFAAAHVLPALLQEFQETILDVCTPCHGTRQAVIDSIAKVHVEFILLHPYREGNGRIARLLALLMSYQAGFPGLDFSFIGRRGKEFEGYIAAIHAGLDRKYHPMSEIILRGLRRAEAKNF